MYHSRFGCLRCGGSKSEKGVTEMRNRLLSTTCARIVRATGLVVGLGALGVFAAPGRGFCGEDAAAAKKAAAEIRELTGAHTRIVWLQDGDENPAPWGGGPKTRVMGLDTDDGKGVRPIFPDGGYSWVYFTPDGKGVACTRVTDGELCVVSANWDGSGLRKLVPKAWLAGVSSDPKGKFTWLYCQSNENGKFVIKRHRLDDPSVNEVVWDKNKAIGRFTVSTDGMMGAGVYDDPGTGPCGVFELPNVAWHQVGNGCQPAMLPGVDPYRLWIFHGDHRSGSIFTNPTDQAKRTQQRMSLADAPGTAGRHEICFPKWSNNVRFMVLSAPYTTPKNEDGIPFPGCESMGGKYKRYHDKVEISIGRLDEGLTKIEKWVQITTNERGDYLPEAWIEPAKK